MALEISTLIFDMDGVIVDTEPIHVEAELLTCNNFGIEAPLSEWENFKGRTAKDIFTYLRDNFGNKEIDVNKLIDYKLKIYYQIAKEKARLIDGAFGFIKKAAEKYELALTTSSLKVLQELMFQKFSLDKFFNIIETGDEIINGKPDPEPYLKTVAKLKIPAETCLVIEDSDNGIISGKKAGCKVAGITTSFERKKLEKAGADYVVDSFQELANILNL